MGIARGTIVLLTLAVVLASCGTTDDADPTSATEPPTIVSDRGSDQPEPPSSDDVRVDAAIEDLAERLGVATDEIVVAAVESVTWNDGALGCPEPGMSYTQSLVPGYRIVLEVDDMTYDYHGADGGDPFLCSDRLADGSPRERP